MAGLPKSYIKKYGITKKAWKEYRASLKKSKTTKKKTTTKKKAKRVASKKKRAKSKPTAPMAVLIGLGAGLVEPIQNAMKGDYQAAGRQLSMNYTGVDPINADRGIQFEQLKKGLLPLVAGALVHKFVGGTLGVNRVLGRAKVPYIRI